MEDMAKYCDDIIVMSSSKLVMTGDRNEIFSRAASLESIGLDIPEITKLMMILRENGVDVPDNIYTVDDAERAILEVLGGGV